MMKFEYIFISNLISSVLMIVFLFSEIIKVKLEFKPHVWKKMFYYGLPLLVAGLAGISNETLDRILIKQTSHPKKIYENYL